MAGEQAPPPLPPPVEIVLIGSSRGQRPSRALPEAEGTDSPPHRPFSDSAEFLWISGRGICKEAIFSPGGKPRSEKTSARGRPSEIEDFAWSVAKRLAGPLGKQPFRRAGRRPRLEVESVHTLSRSPGGVFWWGYWFPTKQVVLLKTLFPTTRAWGALLPYTPSGDGVREGCDPLALSRGWSDGEFDFWQSGQGLCDSCSFCGGYFSFRRGKGRF